MKRGRIFFVALGAFIVAACSSQGVEVRPVTDVLASEPEFTNIAATTATLLVQTDVDLACSVVYGPTSDYGFIATDTDMAAGGHQDHHPLLTGLEPDTLYYARLQGTGPDGTLYRSEEYTFRTEPADSADRGVRLPVSLLGVSSNFSGGADDSSFGALKALDGDPSTEWSSDGEGDEAWIEIEFDWQAQVSSIGFWTRTMGSSAQIESFQVVTDSDETFGPFMLTDAGGPHYFDIEVTTTTLRFEVISSSGGNTGAVEIEVYGELGNP